MANIEGGRCVASDSRRGLLALIMPSARRHRGKRTSRSPHLCRPDLDGQRGLLVDRSSDHPASWSSLSAAGLERRRGAEQASASPPRCDRLQHGGRPSWRCCGEPSPRFPPVSTGHDGRYRLEGSTTEGSTTEGSTHEALFTVGSSTPYLRCTSQRGSLATPTGGSVHEANIDALFAGRHHRRLQDGPAPLLPRTIRCLAVWVYGPRWPHC